MAEDPSTSDSDLNLELRRREERRPVEEAGGGEAEGFELAEQELIDHASHGDEHADADYGEADEEAKPD